MHGVGMLAALSAKPAGVIDRSMDGDRIGAAYSSALVCLLGGVPRSRRRPAAYAGLVTAWRGVAWRGAAGQEGGPGRRGREAT